MKNYNIEVDERVWNYLKSKAEPFVDTPNFVLRRILFGDQPVAGRETDHEEPPATVLRLPNSTPRALAQILEVIYEVKKRGRSRNQATNIVAERRKTAPQTVIDKYCRQLGKRAYDIDHLLQDQNLDEFRVLLESRFADHQSLVASFFASLKNNKPFPLGQDSANSS